MSLLERVRGASREKPEKGMSELDMLRDQVKALVSIDDLALMLTGNPEKARNEIKGACRRSFGEVLWASVPDARRERLVGALLDEMLGFGPLETMLADDEITEIMVNGPDKVFFERGGRLFRSDQTFANEGQLRALIDRMLGPLGRRIDEASPMVNARLPQGHRVHAVIPPLALDGPVLTIRKFTRRVMTLDDMVARGSFDDRMKRFLITAVRERRSVAVSGGTGSGKTTLLNALSCVIPHDERIVTIEDSAELRFLEHPHVVRLEARPRNAEGKGEVTIRDLVINALRMRPDRIVVGECRGAEAFDMLQAMNTGHDGSLTTLHANSPAEAVARLTAMVRYAADLPVDVIEAHIASAFDVVIQMARLTDGSRCITEAASFSFDSDNGACRVRRLFERAAGEDTGVWLKDARDPGSSERGEAKGEGEGMPWESKACSVA